MVRLLLLLLLLLPHLHLLLKLLPHRLLLLLLPHRLLLLLPLQSNKLNKLDEKADASRLFYFLHFVALNDFAPIQSLILRRHRNMIRRALQHPA